MNASADRKPSKPDREAADVDPVQRGCGRGQTQLAPDSLFCTRNRLTGQMIEPANRLANRSSLQFLHPLACTGHGTQVARGNPSGFRGNELSTLSDNLTQGPSEESSKPIASLLHPDNGNQRTIRIVIADDHAIFRDSLRVFLQTERDFRVIGEAADGEVATTLAHRLKPDILLLDISMPRKDGIEVLRDLSGAGLPVRVVVLTAAIGKANTLLAFQLGARGVVFKSFSSTMLFEGIRRVMAGEYWIGQESVASLIDAIGDDARKTRSPNNFGLTAREGEIIAAVLSGYSNPEIAEKFSLSQQTVKHHLTHIFDKLGVYSRLELALFAVNHRLSGE